MKIPSEPPPVPPPNSHYLEAAIGWLMLGDVAEARAEFELVAGRYRRHPHKLHVEWRLLSEEKLWKQAVRVAEAHIAAAPRDAAGYIHRSYALHELKRTAEAARKLLPAATLFPSEPTIPYNLACYACQLADLDNARHWLTQAFGLELDDRQREQRKAMALEDADLKPLWPELKKKKWW